MELTVNRTAIPYFLHLGYIPEPLSIYNEIEKFPSGHWAVFNGDSMHMECYWNPDRLINKETLKNENEATDQLELLLTESVKKRLMSDVPFGTFLSGGVDSSLVTALAQKCASDRLKTFSIGFDDARYNEAGYAKLVADHLKTEHHEYTVSEKDTQELILQMVPQYDEPFADSSAIPTMLVSKMARKEVSMTLSGDGGDELFMGYGAYNWAERLSNPLVDMTRKPIGALLSLGSDRFKRIAKLFQFRQNDNRQAHIFSQEQYMFSSSEIDELLIDPPRSETFNFEFIEESWNRNLSPRERQALFDLRYYLKDDLLTKVDRATMRYSLETRVPLLDHRVVEFALNLDENLKTKHGTSKYLLKKVLYKYVPQEIFDRPKWGFSVPLSKWLQTELSHLIEDVLSEENVNRYGIVKYANVKMLITKYRTGQDHLYNRIWLLIVLHLWFETK